MKRLVVVWLVVAIFGGPVAWGLSDVLGVEAVGVRVAIGAVFGAVSAVVLMAVFGPGAVAAGRRRAVGDRLGDLALRIPFVARRAQARWAPKLFYGDTVIGHIDHAHFAPMVRGSFEFDMSVPEGRAAADAEAEHQAMMRRSIRAAGRPTGGPTTDESLARLTPHEMAAMELVQATGTYRPLEVTGAALVSRGFVTVSGDERVASWTDAGRSAWQDAVDAGVVADHYPPMKRLAKLAHDMGLRPMSGVDPAAGPVAPADESAGGNPSAKGTEAASDGDEGHDHG